MAYNFYFSWDPHNNTWLTSEYLRRMVIHLDFVKNNKIVFSTVSFAGYIGVLTAVKKVNMFISPYIKVIPSELGVYHAVMIIANFKNENSCHIKH